MYIAWPHTEFSLGLARKIWREFSAEDFDSLYRHPRDQSPVAERFEEVQFEYDDSVPFVWVFVPSDTPGTTLELIRNTALRITEACGRPTLFRSLTLPDTSYDFFVPPGFVLEYALPDTYLSNLPRDAGLTDQDRIHPWLHSREYGQPVPGLPLLPPADEDDHPSVRRLL